MKREIGLDLSLASKLIQAVPMLLFFLTGQLFANGQNIDGLYVKALYKKYPTQKTNICPSCKLWVNPYYKSIADTVRHMPIVTYYVYTKAHRLLQESAKIPRTGQFAEWHPAYGQADETDIYQAANKHSTDVIAKGHCQAWILLAWCKDAAILSDTYTFNAGMEFQGQNVGTEIATEELCRTLTGFEGQPVTDSVKVWCGTFGRHQVFHDAKVTSTMPQFYYKIIQYRQKDGQLITNCYWLPNLATEDRFLLAKRMVNHNTLIANLGFDPMTIFK